MSDAIKGYNSTRFQAPGTTVVSDFPCILHSGIKQAILAGTLVCYDSNTAAGTAATNQILSLGTATTMEAGAISVKEFDIQTKSGLVGVSSGTLDYIITTG
jgi:hypothetical protein